ncbi:MAG: glycosyltransferase family 39 protein [Chloroflexi bacterium]|nr:glycosyltransferase family 39 protein [Chloroflexota bacterium]MBV9892930.1 glycosyltransferase family 39 protein [Chloroflexota bacterium]
MSERAVVEVSGFRTQPQLDASGLQRDRQAWLTPARVLVVAFVAAVALLVPQSSILRILPYSPEVDEPFFVQPAVSIAATGDMDPRWFGHPGSTTIYPLAAAYYAWSHLPWGGGPAQLVAMARNLQPIGGRYFLIGRELSVLYAVGGLLLTFLLGNRMGGWRLGIVAMCVAASIPLSVSYGQVVRSDSAATFFGVLSLWAIHRARTSASFGNVVIAGIGPGLAISSRYFMVALIPALALSLWLAPASPYAPSTAHAHRFRHVVWLVLAAIVAFALTTPYLFLDWQNAYTSLEAEAEVSHLGGDGLTFAGNLTWYFVRALPDTLAWPALVMAAIGLATLSRRTLAVWSGPLAFAAGFLVIISISPLHWQRWTIPILPIVSLLAAAGLLETVRRFGRWAHLGIARRNMLGLAGLLLVTALPLYQLVNFELSERDGGVRYAARAWILANVPAGSRILEESYAAPLSGTTYAVDERFSLAADPSLDDYSHQGYNYLITSSAVDDRYLAEASRYPVEVNFYHTVQSQLRLVWESHAQQLAVPMLGSVLDDRCACNLWPVAGPPVIRIYAWSQ